MRKRVTSAIILCGYPPGRAMQTTTFSAGDAASDPDGKGDALTKKRRGQLAARLHRPLAAQNREERQNANRRLNEHACAGRRMLRFGMPARAKSRVPYQGQHQFQGRAHVSRAGTALLRQDPDQLEQRGTLVLHRARSRRCRLARIASGTKRLTKETLKETVMSPEFDKRVPAALLILRFFLGTFLLQWRREAHSSERYRAHRQ